MVCSLVASVSTLEQSVMDSVLNAKSVIFTLLVLIVTTSNGLSAEQAGPNQPESNSTTIETKAPLNSSISQPDSTQPKLLSRRKRFVAFPEGSSFSVSSHNYFELFASVYNLLYVEFIDE